MYAICKQCAEKVYPKSIIEHESLRGTTRAKDKCNMCYKEDFLQPIGDYFFAMTGNPIYFD